MLFYNITPTAALSNSLPFLAVGAGILVVAGCVVSFFLLRRKTKNTNQTC